MAEERSFIQMANDVKKEKNAGHLEEALHILHQEYLDYARQDTAGHSEYDFFKGMKEQLASNALEDLSLLVGREHFTEIVGSGSSIYGSVGGKAGINAVESDISRRDSTLTIDTRYLRTSQSDVDDETQSTTSIVSQILYRSHGTDLSLRPGVLQTSEIQ